MAQCTPRSGRHDLPVTTYLDVDDVERLDALARSTDATRSATVRRIIRATIRELTSSVSEEVS